MAWLSMPRPVLVAFAEELPRVQAGEMLRQSGVIALGTGSLKKGDARKLRRTLERLIAGRKRQPADLRRLEAAGIRVERRGASHG